MGYTGAKKRLYAFVFCVMLIGIGGWWYYRGTSATNTATTSALVAQVVSRGEVTTGIQTTGTIKASRILDLNIYKVEHRIESVVVANGERVVAGQALFSFDENDAMVDAVSSELGVRQAELAYRTAREEVVDPNTTTNTLANDIVVLERNIAEYDTDLRDALREYLNADLTAEPTTERYTAQVERTAPVIGGLYDAITEGAYRVTIYASGEKSGYSYLLSGLESGTYPVYLGTETKLGTRGLTITFPASGVASRDTWVIAVPNTYAPHYAVTAETYRNAVATLNERRVSDVVTLANKRTALAQESRADTKDSRSLEVESASLAVEKARVAYESSRDTRDERRIVAPFAGTVEGMENVVVGATPSKNDTDTIDLGTLISDEFMVTFSLGAADIGTVVPGQRVRCTLTAAPESAPLTATISEVSSLPDSGTVPQYEVRALIEQTASSSVPLRDGMLADVEIVRESQDNVVRVPVSAVHYTDGTPYVTVLENLSEAERTQVGERGILDTAGSTYTSYDTKVELGLRGTYYVEVRSGVAEGSIVALGTPVAKNAESSVRTGFGGGPPREHTTD